MNPCSPSFCPFQKLFAPLLQSVLPINLYMKILFSLRILPSLLGCVYQEISSLGIGFPIHSLGTTKSIAERMSVYCLESGCIGMDFPIRPPLGSVWAHYCSRVFKAILHHRDTHSTLSMRPFNHSCWSCTTVDSGHIFVRTFLPRRSTSSCSLSMQQARIL